MNTENVIDIDLHRPEPPAHYRVVEDTALDPSEDACKHCGRGVYWTIASGHGEAEIAIGTSWGDKELADDICDLMNMAHEEASPEPQDPPPTLEQFIEMLQMAGWRATCDAQWEGAAALHKTLWGTGRESR